MINTYYNKVSWLFPAFEMRYKQFNSTKLVDFEKYIDQLLSLLQGSTHSIEKHILFADEKIKKYRQTSDLEKQIICYIKSCAIVNYLKDRDVQMDFIGPYSMGLYAGLYASGSVTFIEGLEIVRFIGNKAYEISFKKKESYGMGVVVGLPIKLIFQLLKKHFIDLNIADETEKNIIILSGETSKLNYFFSLAKPKGALYCKMLPMEIPYHTNLLRDIEPIIKSFIDKVDIKNPKCPIISCVDQNIIINANDVKKEISRMIWNSFSWRKTFNKLVCNGSNIFIECGMSKNLYKIAKLSQNNIQIYHPKKFYRISQRGQAATKNGL